MLWTCAVVFALEYPLTKSLKPWFGLGYVATELVDECHLPFAMTAERTGTNSTTEPFNLRTGDLTCRALGNESNARFWVAGLLTSMA